MDSLKIKGLTLARAVGSGHPYKHESWDKFYTDHVTGCTTEEALSTKWEINPPDVFTRKQVRVAIDYAIRSTLGSARHNHPYDLEGAQEEHIIFGAFKAAETER